MMALDIERERRKLAKMRRRSSGGVGWRPEDGAESVVRVFTFTHKVTKDDVREGLFPKDALGKPVTEWNRQVTRQWGFTENNAPVFSNQESLALYKELRDSKSEKDKKRAEAIKPRNNYALNIVDLTDKAEKRKVETWLAPKTVVIKIGDYLTDKEYGEGIFGCEGRDFKVLFDKKADTAAKMYTVTIRESKYCKELDSELDDKVADFYDPGVYSSFAQEAPETLKELPSDLEEGTGDKDSTDDELV